MNELAPSRVLIVGDVMLDVYTCGVAERVSPEAPVMVLKTEREETRLGGAGAVAALLASLGAQPVLAGIVGDDRAGSIVRRLLAERKTACRPPLLTATDRPTTVKERLIGQTAGRHGQQMLRVDRESRERLAERLEDELHAAALDALESVQAVLISDYGKGVCSPKLLSALIRAARRRKLPVLVDPRRGGEYELYRWATLIKPNRHEAAAATGREIRCPAQAFMAGKGLCDRWGFQAAVITLDADGMALVTCDGVQEHFRARDHEVADVTGAGDTVLAVLGAALAKGVELRQACRLANRAAALQVEHLGVAPVSWAEITLRHSEQGTGNSDGEKARENDGESVWGITTANALAALIAVQRARGRRIVFTNGCFDLLHAGHVHCLRAAKTLGDILIVAVNSDASVRRLKGASRPVIGERERAAVLAALSCVDYVVTFDDDSPERLIELLKPDVLVKGAEYRPGGLPGESIVTSYGGRVELVPLLPDTSTTGIVERLCSQASWGVTSLE